MSMTTRPSSPAPEAPQPKSEARRDEPENRSKGKDFRERLEKLSKSDVQKSSGKPGETAQSAHPKGQVKGRTAQDEKDREGSAGGGGGSATTAPSDFARAVAIAHAAPADTVPNEQLARIAAALAELCEKGAHAQYQLTLPAGATTIEGAVIGRDPTGKLNVQLIANAAISPAAIQQLQAALRTRLMGRKAQLGKLGVSYGGKIASR
jgi:hypothetical protein